MKLFSPRGFVPLDTRALADQNKPTKHALSVKASLRLAFGVVLAGTLVIGAIALTQISRLNGATESIYTQGHVASRAAEETRGYLLRASRSQKMLLTATTEKERNELGDQIDQALKEIGKEQAELARYTDAADEGQKRLTVALGKWSDNLRTFVKLVKEQPLDLTQMNWQVGTQDISLLVETGKLEKMVDELVARRGAAAKATIETAAFIFHSSFVMLTVLTLALFALAIFVSEWVVRRLARQLGGEPGYAKHIAERIASGDLSGRIKLKSRDDGSMLHALSAMQSGLSGTVGDIAASAEAIASASTQISTGNVDLSRRTEEQAVALEKTAASMEQLTSTVRQNADNALTASTLAANASDIAAKGGKVVSRVVETMERIDASARSIGDIIGVIEGIAFQTNILALNAAVEAARAGEQGRGFAVVAGEVRNLAQRASSAAKEIKQLIDTSVSRVSDGSAYAKEAGSTMTEVVKAVQRVSDIMGEISAASAEQKSGIEEIGRAVTQMDAGTQQNAALVEEAAAAAQSLDDQARSLKELVGKFELA
ncbi:methyl-accepting chemotaxis protein [Caballeronia sp. BR00000012568055]|uniref:methyl-accepting chemotaxis protein n=1 Tax=Caballeronia sp. BR00000012568055 TaxID=2918761 RepID=UPI0023F7CB9F|nr:methyl-accepting chemotaxis protein [Caballeronia sp. BR00000012568055]